MNRNLRIVTYKWNSCIAIAAWVVQVYFWSRDFPFIKRDFKCNHYWTTRCGGPDFVMHLFYLVAIGSMLIVWSSCSTERSAFSPSASKRKDDLLRNILRSLIQDFHDHKVMVFRRYTVYSIRKILLITSNGIPTDK